eukprot:11701268-Alexandrium_andersonii.AAC.1
MRPTPSPCSRNRDVLVADSGSQVALKLACADRRQVSPRVACSSHVAAKRRAGGSAALARVPPLARESGER